MEQQKPNKKMVGFRMDRDLVDQLERVAKRYGWTKTQIIEDLLREALPILEENDPRGLFAATTRKLAETMVEMGDLIDGRNVKSK